MVGNTHRFNVGKFECIALLDGVTEDPVDVLMENINIDAVQSELAKYGLKKGDFFHIHAHASWSTQAANGC